MIISINSWDFTIYGPFLWFLNFGIFIMFVWRVNFKGKKKENERKFEKKKALGRKNGVEWIRAWVLENKLDSSLKSYVLWGFWVKNTLGSVEEAQ